jgi:hypothetical protein
MKQDEGFSSLHELSFPFVFSCQGSTKSCLGVEQNSGEENRTIFLAML